MLIHLLSRPFPRKAVHHHHHHEPSWQPSSTAAAVETAAVGWASWDDDVGAKVVGGQIETVILILFDASGIHFWTAQLKLNSEQCDGRNLSPSQPIKTISVVLESSRAALLIRRTISLIGRLFVDRSGQKQGEKVTSSVRFGLTARISKQRSKSSKMTN